MPLCSPSTRVQIDPGPLLDQDLAPALFAQQVASIGEQLVFLGGSHGWGPGKLTDAQVRLSESVWAVHARAQLSIPRNHPTYAHREQNVLLQLDVVLARIDDAMKGIKAVMTVLRRSSGGPTGKAAAGKDEVV